jgi:branched-chain amino acid aminotransferase
MMPRTLRHTIQVFPNGAQREMDPADRAFKYGDGLFETILLHENQPLNFSAHMARLLHGAAVLGLDHDPAQWKRTFEEAIATLAVEGARSWGRLRLQVWRHSLGNYGPDEDGVHACLEWHALEGDPWQQANAQRLGVCHDAPVVQSALSSLKSCSALAYVYAARQARRAGFDDALLRNSVDGGIAEASAANVFLVRGPHLITPHLRSGCLPGTVREEVLAAVQRLGLELRMQRIDLLDLAEADEIFLTNAIRGLVPVASVEGSAFTPKGHATTDLLRRLVRQARGMDD